MKFTIGRDPLAAVIGRVAPFVQSRSTIPILGCIKIEATDKAVTFSATDMDAHFTETVIADAVSADVSEPGMACLPGEGIKGLVNSLPARSAVEIDDAKQRLNIRCGRTVAHFNIEAFAADFPAFKSEFPAPQITVKAAELDRVMAAVSASMSTERMRPYFCGTYVTKRGDDLVAVATDGHRLMHSTFALDDASADFEGIIVPAPTCLRLRALLRGHKAPVQIAITPERMLFTSGLWSLTSKLIDGTFPEYERVEAAAVEVPVRFSGDEMLPVLERAAALSETTETHGVRVIFEASSLWIEAGPKDAPVLRDAIAATFSGASLAFAVNSTYLRDGINALGGGAMELHFRDQGSPFRLCGEGQTADRATIFGLRF